MPNLKKEIFSQKNLRFNASKIDRNSIPEAESKFKIPKNTALLARTGEIILKKRNRNAERFSAGYF
jgi:hypothetical protein